MDGEHGGGDGAQQGESKVHDAGGDVLEPQDLDVGHQNPADR